MVTEVTTWRSTPEPWSEVSTGIDASVVNSITGV
jgi:hypothetical protein